MSNVIPTDLSHLSQAITALVERTAAGVVAVKAAPYRVVSGVSLRDDLVAVTDHTLKREGRIPIQTAGGTQTTATLLGRDPGLDLAFLKVENGGLTPLNPADARSLAAGALAAVVGMTMDAGPSASLGILGAVGTSRRTWRGGTLDHFFRLDANVYPSQSGAAVVTAEGELIGMATPGLLRHSSVAVPFTTLSRIAEEILKEGRIRHGYLGIGLQPVVIVKHLREKLGTTAESGLIVLSIEPDSPAEKAGLLLGDILISIDGKAIEDVEDLQAHLRGDLIGRSVKVQLVRGGEPFETDVTVAERVKKGN